jgi:hypothetical protein
MRTTFTKAFLLAVALIGAGETIVRTLFAQNMSARFEYGYDATSGFTEPGDGGVRLVRAGGRRFHPRTFSLRRPPGSHRILVIGDSVPRGPSFEDAYPNRLERQLRRNGISAEVINLGVAGYGARRSQIVLEKALDYEPSLVVLHVNSSNEFEDERDWRRKEQFSGWHPRNWLMKSLLVRRLYELRTEKLLWETLPSELRVRTSGNDAADEVQASLDERKRKEWHERVSRITAESVEIARRRGVPVLIVTQVRFEQGPDRTYRLDDAGLDALAASLIREQVYVVSMRRVFETRDAPALFSDSAHLGAEGHEILADAIAAELAERGIVPAPGGK